MGDIFSRFDISAYGYDNDVIIYYLQDSLDINNPKFRALYLGRIYSLTIVWNGNAKSFNLRYVGGRISF